MLKRTFWMKVIVVGVLAVGLYGCANSNGEVSPVSDGHGEDGGAFAAASAHGPLARTILPACQSCHATPGYGNNPRFAVAHLNIPNGCESCHEPLTAHPTPWLANRLGTPVDEVTGLPVTNTTSHINVPVDSFNTACTLCHGASLDGAGGTGPSCMSGSVSGISCHVGNPSQTPSGCVSCHKGLPTGPDGTIAPNRKFAHATHTALNLTCGVCHSGAGYGLASHADGKADVLVTAPYGANNMAFSYGGGSCSGVSCHGGKATSWQGAINVDSDCLACHELGTAQGVPQNNSYYSGKHASHMGGNADNLFTILYPGAHIACTDCHNASKLTPAVHFGTLDTAAFTVPPRDTLGGTDTLLRTQDYVAPATTCGTIGCHVSGIRNWFE